MLHAAISSLRHYWRSNLCTGIGVALAAAVLGGAFILGDSVRFTLLQTATRRLGGIDFAVGDGSRLYAESLAARLAAASLAETVAPLLVRPAVAIVDRDEASLEFPGLQLVGADGRFWQLGSIPTPPPAPGTALVNAALAKELGITVGDSLSLRTARLADLPGEAPLASPGNAATVRLRVQVVGVLDDQAMGAFNLANEQRQARTAFVNLGDLQERLDCPERINLLVVGGGEEKALRATLRTILRPEDYGLSIQPHPELGLLQLSSRRLFLDPPVVAALASLPQAQGTLTYLVNAIATEAADGQPSTPYSFVLGRGPLADSPPTAAPPPLSPTVAINSWLAEALASTPGQALTMRYWVLLPTGGFAEQSQRFQITTVEPIDAWEHERQLSPDFPGLSEVDRCAAWEIGLPMDEEQLADPANEAYWQAFGQTPKAIVPLAAARQLWGNRHGDLMTIRLPLDAAAEATVRQRLAAELSPEAVGLHLRAVRREALAAVDQAQDFGQLFAAMSGFIVVAALLLIALLIAFALQERMTEIGLLEAVGFTFSRIRRQMLLEVGCLAAGAAALGGLASPWYARALLAGIHRQWRGAVAETAILFHARPASYWLAWGLALLLTLATAWLTLRAWRHRPTVALLAGAWPDAEPTSRRQRGERRGLRAGSICLSGAGLVVAGALAWQPAALAAPFFAAGALLLAGGAALVGAGLGRLAAGDHLDRPGGLILGGLARQPLRTTAVVALIATGCFLVFAVSGMTQNLSRQANDRHSGTGGFALYLEASLPILPSRQLDQPAPRYFPNSLAAEEPARLVPMRQFAGDDASCLNLNAVRQPPILGVDPQLLARRGAFEPPNAKTSVWELLEQPSADGSIPALVGDADTATWGLKRKVHPVHGDYLDLEAGGRQIRLKLVGSLPHRLTVFQGRLLISEKAFTEAFPNHSGAQVFLVDGTTEALDELADQLRREHGRAGLHIQAPVDRLATFYRVEFSYLAMFLALGGMGLVVGGAGMGVVTLRNIVERRGELALLRAVGFSRRRLHWQLLGEMQIALLLGLALGLAAAAIALAPALAQGTRPPLRLLALIAAGIWFNGMLCSALATAWIARLPLLAALRRE